MSGKVHKQIRRKAEKIAEKRRNEIMLKSFKLTLDALCGLPFRKRLKVMWLIYKKQPHRILLKYLFTPQIK